MGPVGENRGKSPEPSVTPTGLAAADLTDDALEQAPMRFLSCTARQ